MTKKFNSFYLTLAVILMGALVFAPAATTMAANQDETPDYVGGGDTDVLMLQFDVENTSSTAESLDSVTVSYAGDSLDDVNDVKVLDSGESALNNKGSFSSSSVTISLSQSIPGNDTVSFYLAVDIVASPTDENEVDVALDSISGGTNVSATATLPFNPAGVATIDNEQPDLDTTITGDAAVGNSSATTKVYVSFTGTEVGLDETTVDAADFSVGPNGEAYVATSSDGFSGSGYTVDSAEVVNDGQDVVLTLDTTELATDANPEVAVDDPNTTAGGDTDDPIKDEAGNEFNSESYGSLDTASDGLQPQVNSTLTYNYTSKGSEDSLDVGFSETIGISGSASDYTVVYDEDGDFSTTDDQRTVTPTSISGAGGSTITVTIPDQTMETDPGGDFKVTVATSGIYDQASNTVDASNNSGTINVTDFNEAAPELLSATATSLDTLTASFKEPLASGTVVAGDFTFDGTPSVDSVTDVTKNVVTLKLDGDMDTTAPSGDGASGTADQDLTVTANSVDDLAGNSGPATDTTVTPGDEVSPTMDSAASTAVDTVTVTFSENIANDSVEKADFTVAGNTVTDAASSGTSTVDLTLDTEIATDAKPNVTLVSGESVEDTSGNALSGEVLIDDTTDGISPVLETVDWNDVTGDGTVNDSDKLVLTWSEPIDQTTITDSNVNTNFSSASFGTGAVVNWTSANVVEITLASGEAYSLGNDVTPTTNIKDKASSPNGADTTSAPVQQLGAAVQIEGGASYATIQDAVNNASSDDTILVGSAYGSTDDSGNFPITTFSSGVTIEAAEGASPVIDVDSDGTSAFTIDATGVTIDGLTIKNTANATTDTELIYVSNGTSTAPFTLTNSVIDLTVNTADDVGLAAGAQYVVIGDDSDILADDTEFKVDDGGTNGDKAVTVTTGTVDIDSVLFSGSSGTGLKATDAGTVEIKDSTFDGTKYGVHLNNDSVGVTINSTADSEAETVFENGTWDSEAEKGAAVYVQTALSSGSLDISDTAIADNAGYSVNADDGDNITISESVIQNNSQGMLNQYNGSSASITADHNYWGDDAGPGEVAGTNMEFSDGDAISDYITYVPWVNAEDREINVDAAQVYLGDIGWNMVSVDGAPYNPDPIDLFGDTNAAELFFWDGSDYVSGAGIEEVEPRAGYWYYASSSEVLEPAALTTNLNDGSESDDAYDVKSEISIDLDESETWYMISAPFDVDWGKAKVDGDAGEVRVEDATEHDYMNSYLYHWDTEIDDYEIWSAPDGVIKAGRGYWVKTGTNVPVDLKLPYSPPSVENNDVVTAAASGKPVPEGVPRPPAPPAAQGASGELKATAAVTSDGVTFEVSGADVNSIDVQVFNTNGAEIFSESASGNTLSWNAEVANGVYLYGVSAEVNGSLKPLGIQKLLILQ